MFSYLRPHRRSPSNSTSPVLDQAHSSWDPPLPHPSDVTAKIHDVGPQDASSQASASFLPSMPRVSPPTYKAAEARPAPEPFKSSFQVTSRPDWDISKGNPKPIDRPPNGNFQRALYAATQRPGSAGNGDPRSASLMRTMHHDAPSRLNPSELSQTSVTALDLQTRSMQQTGRRPAGARMPSPTPTIQNTNPVLEPEAAQSRSGKTRLNLLNPMSLLARRRNPQAAVAQSPDPSTSSRGGRGGRNAAAEPHIFDPRIRGTVVHDFSAPRPRKTNSGSEKRSDEPTKSAGRENSPEEGPGSPWSGGNHTPVFKENFEEEQYPATGPLTSTALPLPKPPFAHRSQRRDDPSSSKPENGQVQSQHSGSLVPRSPGTPEEKPPVPPKEPPVHTKRVSIDPQAAPPRMSSSTSRRSQNASDISVRDSSYVLPKHMKSTSSRFSFDMIGAAEQERLLEDRHRQKALEKQNQVDEEYDDDDGAYDYDMASDDGLEEKIPGVNADYEEDEYDYEEPIPGINADLEEEDMFGNDDSIMAVGLQDMTLDDDNMLGNSFQHPALAGAYDSEMMLPDDNEDVNADGLDDEGEDDFVMTSQHMNQYLEDKQADASSSEAPPQLASLGLEGLDFGGLGLDGLGIGGLDAGREQSTVTADFNSTERDENLEAKQTSQLPFIDDDDLYFDDGLIDHPADDDETAEFDESVFDNIDTDQYGRPLRSSFPSEPTLYSPPSLGPDPVSSYQCAPSESSNVNRLSDSTTGSRQQAPELGYRSSVIAASMSAGAASHGLTQDSLAAYQSALAAAAYQAEASGKFRRDSMPSNWPSPSDPGEQQPGLITDSSEASRYEPFSPSYDDFDYDDDLDDDAIIAAANAEALANDDDGFYGQEFGFYSAPAAAVDAEYVNGGYFGPRGPERVGRSQSGRVAVREPNLTPITERSEYSNRNSFMNVPLYGTTGITSPGFTHTLAGMMTRPDYDDDMSLNALLKLRRGAWGGSQASLHSSNGGSPKSAADEMSPIDRSGGGGPWNGSSPTATGGGGHHHRRQNSNFSNRSASEVHSVTGISETSSGAASPNILGASHAAYGTESIDEQMQTREDRDRAPRRHRHTGSADSVSYQKEDDRWVLERRRTDPTGEVAVLGREVVSGGRI